MDPSNQYASQRAYAYQTSRQPIAPQDHDHSVYPNCDYGYSSMASEPQARRPSFAQPPALPNASPQLASTSASASSGPHTPLPPWIVGTQGLSLRNTSPPLPSPVPSSHPASSSEGRPSPPRSIQIIPMQSSPSKHDDSNSSTSDFVKNLYQ